MLTCVKGTCPFSLHWELFNPRNSFKTIPPFIDCTCQIDCSSYLGHRAGAISSGMQNIRFTKLSVYKLRVNAFFLHLYIRSRALSLYVPSFQPCKSLELFGVGPEIWIVKFMQAISYHIWVNLCSLLVMLVYVRFVFGIALLRRLCNVIGEMLLECF